MTSQKIVSGLVFIELGMYQSDSCWTCVASHVCVSCVLAYSDYILVHSGLKNLSGISLWIVFFDLFFSITVHKILY